MILCAAPWVYIAKIFCIQVSRSEEIPLALILRGRWPLQTQQYDTNRSILVFPLSLRALAFLWLLIAWSLKDKKFNIWLDNAHIVFTCEAANIIFALPVCCIFVT